MRTGRPLAEIVGTGLGFSEGQLDEPLSRQVAGLCRKGGGRPGGDRTVD
jgi:hypothetical protein